MAKDPYPAEMVHQWSTLEHQQRETEAAFAGGEGRGSILGVVALACFIAWVGASFLPDSGAWNAWSVLKLNAFDLIGLKSLYEFAPILGTLTIFGVFMICRWFVRYAWSPIHERLGVFSVVSIPLGVVALAIQMICVVTGTIDGVVLVAIWASE